jgi:hypothetical protein
MTKTPNSINNTMDVIDSRDIIERLEYLDEMHNQSKAYNTSEKIVNSHYYPERERAEREMLKKLEKEANNSPDWANGEILIRETYFTSYIKELIPDCYELPKEMKDASKWPWTCLKLDYEKAAEEAKADYTEVDFDGVTYLIRG